MLSLRRGVRFYRVSSGVVLCLCLFELFCAGSRVLAQGNATTPETAAHHAGMYEAYRQCLKQRLANSEISQQDYLRCDQTADRLYFGMYNTPKNYRDGTFVPNVNQVTKNVMAHPDLCQSDEEFDRINVEVLKDMQGFYPDHRQVSCGANPCNLSQKDYSDLVQKGESGTCTCRPSQFNFCSDKPTTPNDLWKALQKTNKAFELDLPEAKIYSDYCLGKTIDGIMFVPSACADGKEMRVLQFVKSTCSGGNCGTTVNSTCGDRTVGEWNLDECPGLTYYKPDTEISGGGHVISDEPTPNGSGGAPYVKQFYDVLMCGNQVMDAFQWTRTGVSSSQVQWCTKQPDPGYTGPPVLGTEAGPYSGVNRVNVNSAQGGNPRALNPVVCTLQNQSNFANDPALKAIQSLAGCSAK